MGQRNRQRGSKVEAFIYKISPETVMYSMVTAVNTTGPRN